MYQVLTLPCIGDVSPLKFNAALACTASLFFFSGWWIMIALIAENLVDVCEFLPGLFATAGMVIVMLIPISLIQQPNLYASNTCCGTLIIRTCLLVGFMVSFGSVIGASYILFNGYLLDKEQMNKWPGFGILLQTLFIFFAAVLLKCTKSSDYF